MKLSEFTRILRKNWQGEETLRLYIKNRIPKYGNNVQEVDAIAAELVEYTANLINGKPNARGGVFRFALFSVDSRFPLGEHTAASADGRFSGEPLSKMQERPPVRTETDYRHIYFPCFHTIIR